MRVPSSELRNSLDSLVEKYHEQVDGAATYLTSRGISPYAIDKFKLGYTGEDGNYKHRLAIPYLTPVGPWHIKYRCIRDHDCKVEGHGKYVYDSGTEQMLYNAQTLIAAERAVIVEGELDAISVEMAGVPAVAFPGADTWRKNRHWRWCFDSCDQVIVVADGDTPREGKDKGVGEEAAISVADSLRTSLPDLDVRVVVMPLGHDANSLINELGQIEFLQLIGVI